MDKADTLVLNVVVQGVVNSTGASSALSVSGANYVYLKWNDILDARTDRGLVITNSSNVIVDTCELSNHIRPAAVHTPLALHRHHAEHVQLKTSAAERTDERRACSSSAPIREICG